MSSFRLAIGIHNHQPVGNFQAVIEEAYQRAYLPFLQFLERNPGVRVSLHQSGSLWQWQKKAHPEFFQLVGRLVDRGQVELLTGGFYEPILTAIPERDAAAQITRLTDYVEDHFEMRPDGLWSAERIWQPYLPKLLAATGVRYLPVDDTHFLAAGFEGEQLSAPFVTEHEGSAVRLLPIRRHLRYLIPFGDPQEIVSYLKMLAERDPDGVAVYADDGEKFGVWPHTHEHCFQDGWLQRFFDILADNGDWLDIVPLGEAAGMPPAGRAYLPSASYGEMLHWSLPTPAFIEFERFEQELKDHDLSERYGRFVRGGLWEGFLAKYDEANFMHKKMLAVSEQLRRFEDEFPERREEAAPARDRLYAGQCNCSYWHGVFGGLYLPHLRQAVYGNLLEAEAMVDALRGHRGVKISSEDYDCDGREEVLVTTEALSAVFKPAAGAMLVHLGLKNHHFDPADTLSRRREGYHAKLAAAAVGPGGRRTGTDHDRYIAKEPGLKDLLVEDWYLKRCFIDHFLTDDVDFERFRTNKYGEEGDFIVEPFSFSIDEAAGTVSFARHGHLWRPDGVVPVRLVKTFTFEGASERIAVTYELSCPDGRDRTVNFAVENNINFQAGHAEDRFILIDGERGENSYLDSAGRHEAARCWSVLDEHRDIGVALTGDRPVEIWHLPIWTVSLSESGFERVYQGTTLVTLYRLRLADAPVVLSQTMYTGTSRGVARAVHRDRRAG